MKTFKMYVKTVVSNDEGKILLLKEKREDRKSRWDLPGAVLTNDDSFDEVVINRIPKEIGYYVYPGKIIGVTNYVTHSVKEIHVIMTGHILNGELLLSNNYENFEWIPLNRLNEYPLNGWLKNYIKHTEEPFNDVSREIEEMDSLQNTRNEMSQDSFFGIGSKIDTNPVKNVKEQSEKQVKSSLGMLKDTILRTFHPKKANVEQTKPKPNMYSTSDMPYINIKEDIIDNTTEQITPDTYEEIVIDRSEDIIPDTPEDNTDNIIINHDYIDNTTNESIDTVMLDENDTVDEVNTKAETASDEIIIEHNTSSADDIVLEHSIDNVTEFDDIVVEHEDTQDPKPEDIKPKKVFDMNVNSANNMKKENKIHEAPKVSKNQNIKVIHNNEKTPYIRKEKQSTQKISFNSEGIKRQGWKEKLDEINRTTSNNEHKVIPRPKGKRKN